jgi:hypothetical protein
MCQHSLHLQDFSPEDGDSMFLRNVGIYLQVHMASHSRETTSISLWNVLSPSSRLQPWRWRQYVSLKRWYLPTSPHGITSQRNNIYFLWNILSPSSGLQPWRWRQYVSAKHRYLPRSPHDITTQKNNTDNFTAVRTSNLTIITSFSGVLRLYKPLLSTYHIPYKVDRNNRLFFAKMHFSNISFQQLNTIF